MQRCYISRISNWLNYFVFLLFSVNKIKKVNSRYDVFKWTSPNYALDGASTLRTPSFVTSYFTGKCRVCAHAFRSLSPLLGIISGGLAETDANNKAVI
jgi:hypothetical protein